MSLAQALAAAEAAGKLNRPPSRMCGACWLLQTLPPDEANALQRLLDSSLSAPDIADILADEGYDVRAYTVQRHARGGCKGAG